jgi:hypothetical protein
MYTIYASLKSFHLQVFMHHDITTPLQSIPLAITDMASQEQDFPDWVLPVLRSPTISINDLQNLYDSLLEQVSAFEEADAPPILFNLQLVSRLLLSVNSDEHYSSVLRTTLHRSYEILKYLNVPTSVDKQSVEIISVKHTELMWRWRNDNGNREILCWDRNAIAKEEEMLLLMAATPIPGEDTELHNTQLPTVD